MRSEAPTLVYAAAAPTPPPAGNTPNQFGPMLVMYAVIAVLAYMLLFRPERQARKKLDSMRETMKKGDRVKTIGGAYGVVVQVDQNSPTVKIELDKNVRVEFDRAAIATVFVDEKDRKGSNS